MWQAYDEFDPIGGPRGDMQAALIASTVANQWRGDGDAPVTVEQMMPDFGGLRAAEELREARAELARRRREARRALAQRRREARRAAAEAAKAKAKGD